MIGIATSDQFPDLYPPDRWIKDALSDVGYASVPVIWDNPTVDWSIFKTIIIRSTWDYYTKIESWTRWLSIIESHNIQLINDISIIRKNIDKKYLKHLDEKGVSIVPSVYVQRGTSLGETFENIEWKKMIIKPTISAGSHLTKMFDRNDIEEIIESYIDIGKSNDLIIQPFLEEIISHGEFSLVYFDNQFSHSIIKRPQRGDFRIQLQFGGQYEYFVPDNSLIDFGYKALKAMDANTVYGRVDCIMVDGIPRVMEVELIEPDLYFDYFEGAKTNYLKALLKHLSIDV